MTDERGRFGGGADDGASGSAPNVDVSPDSGDGGYPPLEAEVSGERGWGDSGEVTEPSSEADFHTPTLDATGADSRLRDRTTMPALKPRPGVRAPWPQRVDALGTIQTAAEKREEALSRRELQEDIARYRRGPLVWPWVVGIVLAATTAAALWILTR